ncbi:Serpin B8 [Orchesella cincta]|uniref:Serpin B8 n=1 Tax=Orchesella cincta TaxID=48709 RepID=A0A1D2MRX9_ORCCI|nr:Serpin B8 [Orchesella cincta]
MSLGKEELIQALFAEDSGATGDGKKMGCDDACSEMIIGIAALLNCIKVFKIQTVERYDDSDSVSFKHDYKMFLDRHHKPKQSYLTRLKSLYHAAGMEEIDLSDENREQAFKKINQWAHSAGSKQLGDILTKRTVGNKIIFVNPLYFMGNWVYPFNPALTQEMKFFINETETGERLALVIFLPNRNGGLPIIESGLESLSPAEYFKDMHKFRRKLASDSRFQVYLPRLRIDCTIDLESPLKEMGVETIFHSGKADFSGLAHISPKELNISQILQKVVIDINETGTAEQPGHFRNQSEAMELTKVSGCGDGDDPGPEIIEFRVDHSFYFQIVDMKSDLIVFAGACKNPLQGKELGFKEFLERYDIPLPPKKLSSDGENIEIPPHILNNTNKC